MVDIDKIISEAIDRCIAKQALNEAQKNNQEIKDLIDGYFSKHGKKEDAGKEDIRQRKLAKGGKEYYNYDDYKLKNKKLATGDANSIRQTIDTEKTNMAAIARILFPDHTEEGAQSQFRKIVNGERPMTKPIAQKVEKMISRGEIAVK